MAMEEESHAGGRVAAGGGLLPRSLRPAGLSPKPAVPDQEHNGFLCPGLKHGVLLLHDQERGGGRLGSWASIHVSSIWSAGKLHNPHLWFSFPLYLLQGLVKRWFHYL
jgi:hypothetical protein